MSRMRASTGAAGRNANSTAVAIRSTADAVALLPLRKTKTPGRMRPPGASRF